MATRNQPDMTQMYRMFDPEDLRKFFDPTRMFAAFEPNQAQSQPFDMTAIYDTNRKNFEAMVEANKAAADAYQDLLRKQMEVFNQLTEAARDQAAWVEDAAGPEAMTKRTEAYGEAVERALTLMRKLADAARDANEEAYAQLKGQVNDAVQEVQKTAKEAQKTAAQAQKGK